MKILIFRQFENIKNRILKISNYNVYILNKRASIQLKFMLFMICIFIQTYQGKRAKIGQFS